MERFNGLQSAIDTAKLHESWDKVKSLLDDLSGVFDSPTDPLVVKPLKCYYCVTSAEYVFHNHNDLASSIDSLRRGYAFQNDEMQLRVVAVRILLITCRSSVNVFSTRQDPTQHYRQIHYKGEDLLLSSSLGDKLRAVPAIIIQKIDSILAHFTKVERCCIVAILETFSSTDIIAIVQNFYKNNEESFDINRSKRDLILIIAQHLLPTFEVSVLVDQYLSGTITSYHYWLALDSILTKATIAEVFGDFPAAVQLVQSVVHYHENIELAAVDEKCIDQILVSVSKLPLLLNKCKNFEESWSTYNKCIYDDGIWASYLPMKTKIALTMKAALQSVLAHEIYLSPPNRESILRAGEYLSHIWHKLESDKTVCVEALSQSSFTSRTLRSLKISCVNVLPDDDTNVPFVAANFDVASVGTFLAALIHYAAHYLDLRLTPSIFLSREYESTFLSYNLQSTIHEIIEWGYQLSLKPSHGALWNMASSCLAYAEEPQRSAELLFRLHQQMLRDVQQYFSDHEIKLLGLTPVETTSTFLSGLQHITSLEEKEFGRGLTILQFPIPQRYLDDPWAAITKYAEIIISHVCTVTGDSYHNTSFSDHWSPSQVELESSIQHVLDAIQTFLGNMMSDVVQSIGIINSKLVHTIHHIVHDVPFQEGLSKQLHAHGLQMHYLSKIEILPREMQAIAKLVIENKLAAISSRGVGGPSSNDYTSILGLFVLLLQLGRLLFHYSMHSSVPPRLTFALQQMSAKLLHTVMTVIEPFIHIPLQGSSHGTGALPHFDSAQNLLSHNNVRFTEYMEVKMTAAFYLAVVYIELRLPHFASKIAREIIQSPYRYHHRGWLKLEIRFLHLLSLAVSASDEGEDPKKLALSIALLQKVIGTSVLFGTQAAHPNPELAGPPTLPTPSEALYLNERYTILLLVLQSGERKLASTIADRLLSDINILIQRHDYEEVHQQTFVQDPTGDASRRSTSQVDPFARIPFGVTMFPDVVFQNDMMIKLVKLLRQIAITAVSLERLTLAKQAVAIAWKSLYTVDAATSARLHKNMQKEDGKKKASQRNLESLAKTHDEIDALRYLPTLLGWRLPEGYGWGSEHHRSLEASLLATCSLIIQQETGRVDDNRAIGLLHLALSHDPRHVETLNALANVSLALYEKDILRKGNPSLSMDLHAPLDSDGGLLDGSTQTSAKNNESFYLKEEALLSSSGEQNIMNSDDIADIAALPNQHLLDMESSYAYLSEHFPQLASPHLAAALFYVRSALAINERSADSWQLMSAIQRALQQGEFSEEAAITALECQVNLPIRKSIVALW